MFVLGVIVFTAVFFLITMFGGGVAAFVDFPSLCAILAISFVIILASGLLKDFIKCFNLIGESENTFSRVELVRMKQSMNLAVTAFLVSGVFITIMGIISLLYSNPPQETILPAISASLLTMLYSIFFLLILLPVKSKVNAVLEIMKVE